MQQPISVTPHVQLLVVPGPLCIPCKTLPADGLVFERLGSDGVPMLSGLGPPTTPVAVGGAGVVPVPIVGDAFESADEFGVTACPEPVAVAVCPA